MAKKRDYTRSPLQKLMRKANDILRYVENNKLETDQLATIKMALEKLNQSDEVNKQGRKDRFADKQIQDKETAEIYKKLAEDLITDANLPQIFKGTKWKKYNLDKQDYLDMIDKTQAIKVHTLESYGLSSEQIGDIYKLTKGAGWDGDKVEEIIHEALLQEISEQKTEGFAEINPDRLSKFIKGIIYREVD